MAGKFYIANSAGFIGTDGKISGFLSEAKRFTMDDANSFINSQLHGSKNFSMQRKFKTGKKYVIMQTTTFVGQNSSTVKDNVLARTFKSVSDAANYIRNNRNLKKYITSPVILDENLEKVDTPPIRQFTEEQLEKLGIKKQPTPTPRIHVPSKEREKAFIRSGGICAICGKPMTEFNRTLDHIIPLSRGGKDVQSNYRYVHRDCNKFKSNMMDDEMYQISTDVEAKYIYENPHSEATNKLLRAYLRGMMNDLKEKGYIV